MRFLYIFILLFLPIFNIQSAERVTFEISIQNHKFVPKILEVPAGKVIVLIVHNLDDVVAEFESFELKREKIIPPGGKIKLILKPMKAGEYEFFEDFYHPNPKGKLVVKD